MRRLTMGYLATTLLLTGLVPSAPIDAATVATPTVLLSAIAGALTPTNFVLDVDVPGAIEAKLIVDGRYIGKDDTAPLSFDVSVSPGVHKLKVRATVGGDELRVDAEFTAGDNDSPNRESAESAPPGAPAPTPKPSAVPRLPDRDPSSRPLPRVTPPANGEIVVDTVDEIRHALATAAPGSVIRISDGEYEFRPRLVASASGTSGAPITLRGSRNAVIRTKNASGDYGLHITGDHWRIEGITVAHATKGIVLDGSVGTVIDSVEVFDIGDEGIHFRSCSSDGVLRHSFIHDTGRNSAQYGEGVYVGSANSNWSRYQCTDPIEGQTQGDNTERVLIEGNVFEDITAEGADLKEGTDSGILRNNTFRRTGLSGMNSADSAVDAKGNNWIIEDNTVLEPNATWDDDGVARPSEFQDGYQTHQVWDGYGTGNAFRRNDVQGNIPGFGIGLYPALGNIVTCDNTAPGAAQGLVGNKSRPSSCNG